MDNRITFYVLMTVLFATALTAADKQKILFFRPAKEGRIMQCRLSAVNSTSNTTSFADINREDKVNSLSRKITADGKLKILSVKKSGHAAKIEFTFDSIQGTFNKTIFKPAWSGKTILADLKVRPICDFRIKNSNKKLSSMEVQMLSLLFHPAPEENISDYIGTDKPVGIGDSWSAKVLPFIKLFKKQGLILHEKHIKGSVTLKSRKTFEGIECWEIEEKLNVHGLPNFTFHFSLSTLLPLDSRYGNIKMTRKAFERIEKLPAGKHFMTSGIKKITLEMKDTMTAIMLPVGSSLRER